MKRFYIAICLVCAIIITSVFLNFKVKEKSLDLIRIIESKESTERIVEWWQDNEVWFEIVLTDELNTSIELNIIKLQNDTDNYSAKENIKNNAKKIIEETKFSIKKIF